MKICLHHSIVPQYTKFEENTKKKFKERRDIFLSDPYHPLLNNHPLRGKYEGYRSINIAGNVRVIYKHLDIDTVLFVKIGSHSNLYK